MDDDSHTILFSADGGITMMMNPEVDNVQLGGFVMGLYYLLATSNDELYDMLEDIDLDDLEDFYEGLRNKDIH